MAFERLYGPILPHERVDYSGALVSTVAANLWSKRRHELKDFLPRWLQPVRPAQTPEVLEMMLRSWVAHN